MSFLFPLTYFVLCTADTGRGHQRPGSGWKLPSAIANTAEAVSDFMERVGSSQREQRAGAEDNSPAYSTV